MEQINDDDDDEFYPDDVSRARGDNVGTPFEWPLRLRDKDPVKHESQKLKPSNIYMYGKILSTPV